MKTATETSSQTLAREVSLYRIEESLIGLMEAREAAETDEEKALSELAILEYMRAEVRKVDGILAYIRHCRNRAEEANKETHRLAAIERTWLRRAERIGDATKWAMESFSVTRLEGALGSLHLQKNPAKVEIYDETLIPLEYKTASVTMPAELWVGLCDFLMRYAAVVETLAPSLNVQAIVQAADQFTCRKAEIGKELKREHKCEHGILTDEYACDHCGGMGTAAGRVAGARLVSDTRLVVK